MQVEASFVTRVLMLRRNIRVNGNSWLTNIASIGRGQSPQWTRTQAVGFLSYMGTITRLNGRRYFTYSNDHPPAHVHVSNANGKAKFELNCTAGPVRCVKAARRLSDQELLEMAREIEAMLAKCCQHWSLNHGAYI